MRNINIIEKPIVKYLFVQFFNLLSIFLGITFLAFFLIKFSTSNISILNIFKEFLFWFIKSISGNLGETLYGEKIINNLLFSLFNTIKISFGAILFSFIISAVISWLWYKIENVQLLSKLLRLLITFSNIPLFLAAFIVSLLVNYFAIDIYDSSTTLYEKIIYYFLPILILSIFDGTIYEICQSIKSTIEQIKNEPFIIALELRGYSRKKHILRHLSFTLLDILSSKLVHFLGGAIVVEIIFNIHGIGYLGYRAIQLRDFNLFLAIIFFVSLLVLIIFFIIKVVSVYFNPTYKNRINTTNSFLELMKI